MRTLLMFIVVALIAAGCGAAPPSAAVRSQSPVAGQSPSPSGVPSPSATPSASPIEVGSAVVTVSDRLRVRSAPGVSDDSIKYEPLLPVGTDLLVVGGPVEASGYVWWKVEPLSLPLQDADVRWVAMADHDGEPWIELAGDGTPSLGMAVSDVARKPVGKAEPGSRLPLRLKSGK